MKLADATEAWLDLQALKIKYLQMWEPQKGSLGLHNLTSIPEMAKALNLQMASAMDVKEVHSAAHKLAQVVAGLSYEDFVTWNQHEVERAMNAGEHQSRISSEKLMTIIGPF